MTQETAGPPRTREQIIEAFYGDQIEPEEFCAHMGALAARAARMPTRLRKAEQTLLLPPTPDQSRGYKWLVGRRK